MAPVAAASTCRLVLEPLQLVGIVSQQVGVSHFVPQCRSVVPLLTLDQRRA